MRIFKCVRMLVFALLPSAVKVAWLRSQGHEIAENVRIGFSILDIKKINLSAGARIGNGNVFKGMQFLHMGERSSIGRFNVFTCNHVYLMAYPGSGGRLIMADRAVITMRHYFDVQHEIRLGQDSLVAGIQTIFFTHQKGFKKLNEAKPISVGDRVYLGASCKIMPGTSIASHCVIGAGSIVRGHLDDEYGLYMSPGATLVKKLPKDSLYFSEKEPTALND